MGMRSVPGMRTDEPINTNHWPVAEIPSLFHQLCWRAELSSLHQISSSEFWFYSWVYLVNFVVHEFWGGEGRECRFSPFFYFQVIVCVSHSLSLCVCITHLIIVFPVTDLTAHLHFNDFVIVFYSLFRMCIPTVCIVNIMYVNARSHHVRVSITFLYIWLCKRNTYTQCSAHRFPTTNIITSLISSCLFVCLLTYSWYTIPIIMSITAKWFKTDLFSFKFVYFVRFMKCHNFVFAACSEMFSCELCDAYKKQNAIAQYTW